MDEALLRVFQGVDAPVAPGYRGLRPFLSGRKYQDKTNPEFKFKQILPGITDADFAEHRSRLRAVTVTDVRDVAQRLANDVLRTSAVICISSSDT